VVRLLDWLVDPTSRRGHGLTLRFVPVDTETFGRFSETIARFIGTARFLVYQSAFIVAWIVWNVVFGKGHRFSFDPYPFQFLTLILSLQAAYAAPLILLAQNRQEERDRRQNERDRQIASRTQADAEFITRELASIRLALADVATVDEVEKAVGRAIDRADRLASKGDASRPSDRPNASGSISESGRLS
jgi:uncharacterized membrane protein